MRLQTALERRLRPAPAYRTQAMGSVLTGLEGALGAPLAPHLGEPDLHAAEERMRERVAEIPPDSPLPPVHVSDLALARLLYAICRALRPRLVLETGVAYGQSSALMLRALAVNGEGLLHSVDLSPSPEAEPHVGSLVPDGLRARWTLHSGATKRVLPSLLPTLGGVDLFIHDSRHTYVNILRELRSVGPHLSAPGVVVADDIERHSAWARWTREAAPAYAAAVQEPGKPAICGVAVLQRRSAR